jgi:hypothetical protein
MSRRALIVVLVLSLLANAWLLTRRGSRSLGPSATEESRPGEGAGSARGGSGRAAVDPHDQMDPLERGWIQEAGFAAPAESLRADLLRHPELISAKGITGGTMAFRTESIYLLPGSHVWAIADDGHIETALLLRYDVRPDTTFKWTVAYHWDEP